MDFATLELIIDASQAERATDTLDDLTEAGKRAEKSTDDLSGSTRSYAGAASRAAEQAARQAATTTAGAAATAALAVATVAVTVATVTMVAAWRRRQEMMEEARRETERAIQTLEDLRREAELERQGPGAEWIEPIRLANEELVRMQTETQGAYHELVEFGGALIQIIADADALWEALGKVGRFVVDWGLGLGHVRNVVKAIDMLTGNHLATQRETTRLAKEEAVQSGIQAGEHARRVARLNAWLDAQRKAAREAAAESAEAAAAAAERERERQKELSDLEEGARLRTLQNEDILRAWELERQYSDALKAGNQSLAERNRLVRELAQLSGVPGVGGMTPSLSVPGVTTPGTEGMILTRMTGPGGAARRVDGPTEEEVRRFGEAMEAARELTAGIRDLADAMDTLSPALAGVLRGVDTITQGAMRFRESQSVGGWTGAIGQVSGALSVGAGVVQVISSLLDNSEEREQRARMIAEIKRSTEALKDFAAQIRGVTELQAKRAAASDLYGSALNASAFTTGGLGASSPLTWVPAFVESMVVAGMSTEEIVHNLQGLGVAVADTVAFAESIDLYRDALGAIEEWRQREIAGIREEIDIRRLVAQGRSEEAEARRREIAQREELARVMELGDEQLTADMQALHAEETAAAEAAAEAARQLSIANFDVEISARRAAQAGDDLAAMQIRGEAAIAAQVAEWQKLVESGHMTQEQLLALSDIMRDELAASIEAAADAARRASEDFMGMLHIEDLMASGDTTGAAIARAEQRAAKWIEQANDLDLTAEQYETAMETINRITRNTIDGILADAAEAGVAAFGSSIVDREAERAVVRSARSITSVQAETLADIGWSQLSVLQEIAVNTRGGVRGSDGVDGYGRPISTGPATVQNTGQQIHVHLHAGNIIGPDDVVGFVIDGVSRALGQEELDTATQDGSAFVP